MKLITNDKKLVSLIVLLPEIIAIVSFLLITLEIDITLEIITLPIELHQDHVHDLRLRIEDVLIMYNKILQKILTATLTASQSRKAKLKLTYIPLK